MSEPDFAYAEPPRRRDTAPCRVAFIQRPSENARQVKFWNCGELGHRYSRCDKEKKRFCFGCGQPDLIKSKCSKCQPKNGPARGNSNNMKINYLLLRTECDNGPYLDLRIFTTKIRALLDSGASTTFIQRRSGAYYV